MTTPPVSPKPPMKLHFTDEWLRERIAMEPDDGEIGAGMPCDTPEDIERLLEYMRTIQAAQAAHNSPSVPESE